MNDEIKYICPHCESNVKSDDRFCINCGESFENPSVSEISELEQGWWKPFRTAAIVIGVTLLVLGLLTSLFHYLVKREREKKYESQYESVETPSVESEDVTEMPIPEAVPEETVEEVYSEGAPDSMTLNGTVAGSNIVMYLDNENGNLSGYYYYTKMGRNTNLHVSGTLSDDGTFQLEEYNQKNGVHSGSFYGNMSGGEASGTFTNSRGNDYDFYLTVQ